MTGQILHEQRLGMTDQVAEQAPSVRQVVPVQVLAFLRTEAEGDELLQSRPVRVSTPSAP